jgi:hypothetical protein
MEVAFELVLAVSLAVAGAAWAASVTGRATERALRGALWVLGALAVAGAAGLVVGLATDRDGIALAIAFGGTVLAVLAGAGAIAHTAARRRLGEIDERVGAAIRDFDERLEAHGELRAAELARTLARERAETSHLLVRQERELAEARRLAVEQQAAGAGDELTARVADLQARHEQRLTAWASDLERAQRELKERLEQLIREQVNALRNHEQRLADHAREVQSLSSLQHETVERLRTDFAREVAEAYEAGRSDIEGHAAEQRRATSELGDRLRLLTRSLREDAEREEADARTRLAATIPEVERRVLEQLDRSLQRASDRLVEEAERRFDVQIKHSREETAERLARELERGMEHFTRQAEKDVEARMSEVAQATARRLQRQLDEVVRGAEAQTSLAAERIQFLTARPEKALDDSAGRLASFEADLELQLTAKLAEFERALRQAEQSVSRELS